MLVRLTAGDVAGAAVRVISATPALPVSGDSTATAGTPYTLTLGDGTINLGSGTNVVYDVSWGDGSQDTLITADALAAADDQVTHTYATAGTGESIAVDLDVDDENSGQVGSFSVTVGSASVDPDATTTTLTPSSSSPAFQNAITLTAIVAAAVSATGTPSGTVEFYDGTIDLGPGTINYNGDQIVATLNTPPLALGDHGFSAVYSGDDTFESSTGTTVVSVTSGDAGSLPNQSDLTLTGTSSVNEGLGSGSTYTLTLPTTAGSSASPVTQWVINWGDGSQPQVVTGDPTPASETYHYQAPGNYLIQAIATAGGNLYSAVLNNDSATKLDPSYNVTSAIPGTIDAGPGSVSATALQPDGSIVAVQGGTGLQPVLVRYDDTGAPDGTVFDDVSSALASITAVAVQPQPGGNFGIVAAGPGVSGGYAVARFNSDGTLDTTFGDNGTMWVNPAPRAERRANC